MKHQESDVSILIPTYNPGPYLRTAIENALATAAGEILVSVDDSIHYPVDHFLNGLTDNRLKIIRQNQQLGLWKNHLELLKISTKKWIKILQHDDKILPGFLKTMLAYTDEGVSVVGTLPIYENLSTGEVYSVFKLSEPKRWESDAYMKRILVVGNELGTPSCTLFRRDAIDITPEAWDNSLSCDFLSNVIASSRGDVVLLPPSGIITGIHNNQDGRTQGFLSMITRLKNTVAYLQEQPDWRVVRVGRIFGAVEYLGLLRVILGAIRRGDVRAAKYLGMAFLYSGKYMSKSILTKDWYFIKNALFWKYGTRTGRDVGIYEFTR